MQLGHSWKIQQSESTNACCLGSGGADSFNLPFVGVANSVANIHRVVIDGTFAQVYPEDFAVGTVLISVDNIFADGFE